MSDYYDRGGNPITLDEFAALYRGDANVSRQVARTQVHDATVSTVHLGLDHRFGDGPPLIFETLIFDGPHDQDMERYSTLDQAEVGHAAIVERLRAEGPWCTARFSDRRCDLRDGHDGWHSAEDYDEVRREWREVPS